jgi:glycosyltransferase involved in cell wall biosynthesis
MIASVLQDLGVPLHFLASPPSTGGLVAKIRDRVHRNLFGNRVVSSLEPAQLQRRAAWIEHKLASIEVDVLLSNASRPLALINTSRPIVIWRDSTFAGALKVHRDFRNLAPRSVRLGHQMEQAALQRCTVAVFRSHWAADDACRIYGVNPHKVRVIPVGGNIRKAPPRERVAQAIASRSRECCELLFVGVDWEGKGGPVALEICRRLRDDGVAVRLTVVGAEPGRLASAPPYVRDLGFIDIHTEAGRRRYTKLLETSHFLLFPSRVDTYGNVLPEANAFGLPALASDNAGIPTIVKNGINGQLFPIGGDAEALAYSRFIQAMLSERTRYDALALSSYDEYATRLSWDVVGPELVAVLREVCQPGAGR